MLNFSINLFRYNTPQSIVGYQVGQSVLFFLVSSYFRTKWAAKESSRNYGMWECALPVCTAICLAVFCWYHSASWYMTKQKSKTSEKDEYNECNNFFFFFFFFLLLYYTFIKHLSYTECRSKVLMHSKCMTICRWQSAVSLLREGGKIAALEVSIVPL